MLLSGLSALVLALILVIIVDSCRYQFKVYVYQTSPHLNEIGEQAIRNNSYHICQKCIYVSDLLTSFSLVRNFLVHFLEQEQFALEFIVYDFFTQFCGRTYDPEEADYFYIPIIRDVEYRMQLQNGGRRDSVIIEKILLEALEKNTTNLWNSHLNITDKYWYRHNGADHIIVMPAPVTNLRHETNARGYFHYMIHLRPPIFLNVEYSRSFIKEYPICANEKNLMLPYPSTDPDLYNYELYKKSPKDQRNKLLYYQGGNHGSCMSIRTALQRIMKHKEFTVRTKRRESGFQQSLFCPIPVGDSPSSKRMYDVMHFGCIPVILSDDLMYSFARETGGPLDMNEFVLQLPQAAILLTASELLVHIEKHSTLFPLSVTPSGIPLMKLIRDAANGTIPDKSSVAHRLNLHQFVHTAGYKSTPSTDTSSSTASASTSAMMQILLRLSTNDIHKWQSAGVVASTFYRFYNFDPSMRRIPTGHHRYPDGAATDLLGKWLEKRREKGVAEISQRCQAEKNRPGHKYLPQYPCELKKRRRRLESAGAYVVEDSEAFDPNMARITVYEDGNNTYDDKSRGGVGAGIGAVGDEGATSGIGGRGCGKGLYDFRNAHEIAAVASRGGQESQSSQRLLPSSYTAGATAAADDVGNANETNGFYKFSNDNSHSRLWNMDHCDCTLN